MFAKAAQLILEPALKRGSSNFHAASRGRTAPAASIIIIFVMAFPIKTCAICGEEFELKPGKPGFANRCPECSEEEAANAGGNAGDGWKGDKGANAARREAMRNL